MIQLFAANNNLVFLMKLQPTLIKTHLIVFDIRDRAGWTVDKKTVVPKMAALTAEALMEKPIQRQKTLHRKVGA